MLSIDSLHVTYGGAVQALRGVSMEVPDGKVVARPRQQRRGQDDAAAHHLRHPALHRGRVESGRGPLRRHRPQRPRPGRSRPQRAGAGARGPAHLQPAHRRGEPARRRHGQPGQGGEGEGPGPRLRAVPGPRGAQRPARRPALRRRAADAGHRPGADGQPEAAAARRAVARASRRGSSARSARSSREINRQGTSVLLVEQNATMALGVADLAYVLDVGEVSLSGDAARARADRRGAAPLPRPRRRGRDVPHGRRRPPARSSRGGRRDRARPPVGRDVRSRHPGRSRSRTSRVALRRHQGAVRGLLHGRARHVHAIIGPNGAGKSTMFNVLSGVYRATEGQVRFGEHRPRPDAPAPDRRHRRGPGLPEHRAVRRARRSPRT